ncbi:MAG: hypothetical protein H6833_11430 [Planctomycetes bacterium]|nr:hypothetical protein [Planctomycetota bacterium]
MDRRRRQTAPSARGNAALLLLLLLVAAGAAVFWFLRSTPATHEPAEPPKKAHARAEEPERPATASPVVPSRPSGETVDPPTTNPPAARPTLPTDEPRYDASGDRIVIGLDGLELRQPKDANVAFGIFREGERNELGLPTGVLPDGSWVYYNIPTTVTQNGKTIETLNRYLATPAGGRLVDPETGQPVPGVGGQGK